MKESEQRHSREIPIDGRTIALIFQSETVRLALQKILIRSHAASNFQQEAEQGVIFFLDPQTVATGRPSITAIEEDEVVEYNSLNFSQENSRNIVRLYKAGQYPVFMFHTHTAVDLPTTPYQLREYIPSVEDLRSFAQERMLGKKDAGYDGYPILAIGMVYADSFHMLLIQETASVISSEQLLEIYEQSVLQADSFGEIKNILVDYGYKVGEITYKPDKKRPLSPEDKKYTSADICLYAKTCS